MALPRGDIADLFVPYPSSPASIDAAAGQVAGTVTGFESVRDQVITHQRVAVASTTGDLLGPISIVARPVTAALDSLAGASVFAAAAVRRWAGHVVTYDSGVSDLNARWRSAVAANLNGSGSEDLSGVRSALQTEHARLEATLDTGAADVARLLGVGPTAQTMLELFTAGALPAAAFLNGPQPATGIESTVARLITSGVLPPEAATMSAQQLADYLVLHPEVAATLMDLTPQQGTPGTLEHELAVLSTPVGPGQSAQRQLDIRALFSGMDPDDAAILAMLFPAAVGNTAGVPFANRADANRVAVIAALSAEEGNLADLQQRDAANEDNGPLGWGWWDDDDLDGAIDDAEERIALYRSIIDGDRQILYFDPTGDGAIAELHGTIGPGTDNVGVIVPGTGSDMSNIQGTMDNAQSFVDNDPTGGLAMITWMGGDLPDGLDDAPYNDYSDDLAPSLVGFSQQLGDEIDAEAHPGTQVTVAGHSYGGAVVGVAETQGLETDRVLHVESAGMGRDVTGAENLPASQAGVDRYSMTAPGDPIELTQGVNDPLWIDRVGHGADPDTFPGTVRLETGYYADGEWIEGSDAHSGVFQQGSDAWHNMYEVFTGGEVTLYAPPDIYLPPGSQTPIIQPNTDPRDTLDIP
jgi:hypothetical protein